MTTLSGPAKSGYEGDFETTEEARAKAAELLGCSVENMIEVESGSTTTYCYATQEEADKRGLYPVHYTEFSGRSRRYTLGTEKDGNFDSDTLGSDPDLITFQSLDAAIADATELIADWPDLSYGDELTGVAIYDEHARVIVWRQPEAR